MILRLLNWQGIAGIAASLALVVLLLVQKGETHHWKRQSGAFEQLYRAEQAALAATVANTRAAAEAAHAADQANVARVAAGQRAITERTAHDYETRLAAARTAAERLRRAALAPADPRPRGSASMPAVSLAGRGAAQAAGEDRLPQSDALIATEQAIQLDELIKWVRGQAEVSPKQR
jgi:signal transduction histidine kinase